MYECSYDFCFYIIYIFTIATLAHFQQIGRKELILTGETRHQVIASLHKHCSEQFENGRPGHAMPCVQ